MNILISVPDTNIGGITTAAVNLSNELMNRGHNVYFLDMSGKNECTERLNNGIILLSLKSKSKFWNIGIESVRQARGIKKFGVLALGAVKKLTIRSGYWYRLIFSKFNKNECFDVAIAFRQCAPCYSFVLNKVNAKKKIGFVHGELTYMDDISSWKKYMTEFDKIAYVSNAVQEQFVAKYPELKKNACTIYNMFDVEQIKRLSAEKCDVEFEKNTVNIVTVARIENGFKQTHLIVEVCERIKRATSVPFHWYVVGDGPDFDATVALSHQHRTDDVLTFVGNKKNPYPFIEQSDFTVLTSKSESFGMVLVESFVLQKPTVVAYYPAVSEIMETERNGLIAEQSIESLTECIARMIENRDCIWEKCTEFLSNITINNDLAYEQFVDAIK